MERTPTSPLRDVWTAFWTSRLAVWAAGVLGLLWFGQREERDLFDPDGVTRGFGGFGDLLLAPAARWDTVWYLAVANDGYGGSADHAKAAFYPLYPLVAKVVGWPLGSTLLGGLAVSFASFFAALLLFRRLAEIEVGRRDGQSAVLLLAFFPTAFFFSAVYAEALFLLLSVGALLAARQERWAVAGIVGALAVVTRNSGIVLLVPLAVLYLYGPRGDRAAGTVEGGGRAWWAPRFPVRWSLGWLALLPLALAAYLAYLGIAIGAPLAPFAVQELWGRHFVPLGAVWQGTEAAWLGLRQLVSGSGEHVFFTAAGGDPIANAGQNLMLFGFLVFAVVALVGAFRRLPFAYGAYAGVTLALSLSSPVAAQPLMSLPRFVLVLFPLQLSLACWLGERGDGRPDRAIAISAVPLGLMTAQFARWGFVA